MFSLHVWMCSMWVLIACRGQNRASGILELEFTGVVCHHVGAENHTQPTETASIPLNCCATYVSNILAYLK